ncbi:hypothetical protein Taro_006821 [Colocasia esculenta]|uniref:Uncharacterized protein n=1 Tax=Colocasia esculenta TaxID=4460 RepID=A0A843TSA5_COLES|nr:hypothetical protein [Colocasia esculenta]
MLPSLVWYVCGLWEAPGWSMPWVYLSAGVATAVRVATPEKAVAITVPFPIAMDLLVGNAAGCLTVFSYRRCLTLEGLSRSEVASISWDPHPREPLREHLDLRACSSWQTLELRGKQGLDSGTESFVELSCLGQDAEVVEVFSSRRGPDSPFSHCLALRWFQSRVGRSGVGLQLGQAAVVCAFLCCFVAALSRSSEESRSLVPVYSGTGVCGFPTSRCVQGDSVCGPSTLWRRVETCFRVVLDSVVPAALAGARRHGSSVSDGFAEMAVTPCVVSSSKSECCELLYLSELRVVLRKFSGVNFGVLGGGLGGLVVTSLVPSFSTSS